jgi:hypothetical protein
MKRGRPSARNKIKPILIEILTSDRLPKSANSLKKTIDRELKKDVSWNTIKKYLDELVQTDVVQPIRLQHSKEEKREGLTLYTLKR